LQVFGVRCADVGCSRSPLATPTSRAAESPSPARLDQDLVGSDFLGRDRLKHADHDAELTAIYGKWRAADPGWKLFDDRSIVELVPWAMVDEAGR
jgi:hypothetical protein